jgi:hypothetical protein
MARESVVRVMRDDMNRLRGRLFGLVEATGMPEKQEEAFKKLIRQLTYATQADLEETLRSNGSKEK